MSEKILELKPCPFCGKPPSTLKNMGTIYCPNNECFGPQTTAERLEDSAVQWNARASSPAQETVTTEPVAWRYQRKEWDALLWRYQTEALVNDDFETPSDWLIEPLYAIPAPPPPGPEWREWRQIETAPKNGTFVDLLFRGNVRIADCIWYRDAWWATEQRDPSVCVSHGLAQPTHWMPMPTPAALTGEPK